jgi:hypothetical protein
MNMYKYTYIGLFEVTIQSGAATGYGVRSWPFRIGGIGLIHDGIHTYKDICMYICIYVCIYMVLYMNTYICILYVYI